MPVMFGMFELQNHKEKGEATLFIGEGADFIGLSTKFSEKVFARVGGADM